MIPSQCTALHLSIAISAEIPKIRPMASVADLRRQIDQTDRQIIDLLARRTKMMKGVLTQQEGDDPEWEEQVLSNWLEEAFDAGMDEGATTKVCKSVMDMGKKTAEL